MTQRLKGICFIALSQRNDRTEIAELLADEQCSQAIHNFLATRLKDLLYLLVIFALLFLLILHNGLLHVTTTGARQDEQQFSVFVGLQT